MFIKKKKKKTNTEPLYQNGKTKPRKPQIPNTRSSSPYSLLVIIAVGRSLPLSSQISDRRRRSPPAVARSQLAFPVVGAHRSQSQIPPWAELPQGISNFSLFFSLALSLYLTEIETECLSLYSLLPLVFIRLN